MSQPPPPDDIQSKLRRVPYMHWTGIWGSWEPVETSLLAFVYDAHADACGVFPPFHLLNQFLLHGGGGGGMGPGEKWEPFALSREEYDLLVEAIRTVPPESIEGLQGPPGLPFTFDPEFDGDPAGYPVYPGYNEKLVAALKRHKVEPEEYFLWHAAVCGKHREAWHAALERAREKK